MKTFSDLIRVCWVAAVVAIVGTAPVYAADAVGRIIAVEGKPLVERSSGGRVELQRDDPVYIGDVVRTGSGRCKILFEDNSIMTLGTQTELKISEFLFDSQKQERSSMFDLITGKVKTLVGKLFSSATDFKVRTPSAVAGVRGTFFRIDASDKTDVTVFDGEVEVSDKSGNALRLTPGTRLSVSGSGFLGGIQQLSPQQLSRLQHELDVRLEDSLNNQADRQIRRRDLTRRAVESLEPLPTGKDEGGAPDAGDNELPPSAPVEDLQSVDPARTGNANIQLQFVPEQQGE